MHPALSVIIFTTASGTGYGLLMVLILLNISGRIPTSPGLGIAGFGIGLTLVTVGLLASTFHLGHPERAWRALSQWRSSWLSREGVLAIVTYPAVLLYATAWILTGDTQGDRVWTGLLAILLAGLTVVCTGMIYAGLKTIPQWRQPLTPVNYLMLALAAGAVWLMALTTAFGINDPLPAQVCAGLIPLAWILKHRYWTLIDRQQSPHTIGTATGLGELGEVTLLEPPHTEPNFVQKEMGFSVARRHAKKLRRSATLMAFTLPLALTVGVLTTSGLLNAALAITAALSISAGLLVERWLFFAQATHVSMLYYGGSKN
jgi:DMSO reductase anchor subunit